MLEYDHIALDALNALENCLGEWPTLIEEQQNFWRDKLISDDEIMNKY